MKSQMRSLTPPRLSDLMEFSHFWNIDGVPVFPEGVTDNMVPWPSSAQPYNPTTMARWENISISLLSYEISEALTEDFCILITRLMPHVNGCSTESECGLRKLVPDPKIGYSFSQNGKDIQVPSC